MLLDRSRKLANLALSMLLLALLSLTLASAAPSSPHLYGREDTSVSRTSTFVSKAHPDVNLTYVTNSGVCETTPGVKQMSGYINIGDNMSMVRNRILGVHIQLTGWLF